MNFHWLFLGREQRRYVLLIAKSPSSEENEYYETIFHQYLANWKKDKKKLILDSSALWDNKCWPANFKTNVTTGFWLHVETDVSTRMKKIEFNYDYYGEKIEIGQVLHLSFEPKIDLLSIHFFSHLSIRNRWSIGLGIMKIRFVCNFTGDTQRGLWNIVQKIRCHFLRAFLPPEALNTASDISLSVNLRFKAVIYTSSPLKSVNKAL